MTRPKLTMLKEDVEQKMISIFRSKVKDLQFSRNQIFEKVDDKTTPFFQLDSDYKGLQGEYGFTGQVYLYTAIGEGQFMCACYRLSGKVEILESDDEPDVIFKNIINATPK